MTPPYRLADLSAEQMQMIEHLENEIGLTLVAYEPEAGAATHTGPAAACDIGRPSAAAPVDDDENQRVLDALVDTYRSHQPYI
jgi:heterodisulfide reductase subunit B